MLLKSFSLRPSDVYLQPSGQQLRAARITLRAFYKCGDANIVDIPLPSRFFLTTMTPPGTAVPPVEDKLHFAHNEF